MSQTLTEDQVRKVAKLARLELTDTEVQRFATQLSDVLAFVSKLDELDVSTTEPMAHTADLTNVLREDTETTPLPTDLALKNAPGGADQTQGFFSVPKVLGDASSA